VAIDKRSLTY